MMEWGWYPAMGSVAPDSSDSPETCLVVQVLQDRSEESVRSYQAQRSPDSVN